MATQTMGTKFPAELAVGLFNLVRGKSSLARLSQQIPVGFTGTDVWTFDFDSEVSVVGEGSQKSHGGITASPVKIVPVKIEYGARVTDEFLIASETRQLEILAAYQEAFARKAARALDIMALHGHNPSTGSASTVIGNNHIDNKATQLASQTTIDAGITAAVAALGDYDLNGIILSKNAAAELAATTVNGVKQYPELQWGASPDTIHGVAISVNSTAGSGKVAYAGDYDCFRWGYAKDIFFKVIEYGDPDNSGVDLAGSNMVYLRSEAYIGWGILDGSAFCKITV